MLGYVLLERFRLIAGRLRLLSLNRVKSQLKIDRGVQCNCWGDKPKTRRGQALAWGVLFTIVGAVCYALFSSYRESHPAPLTAAEVAKIDAWDNLSSNLRKSSNYMEFIALAATATSLSTTKTNNTG